MQEKEIENAIKQDIEEVFSRIIADHNFTLPITANSRSGAEISDFLEDAFVSFVNKNKLHSIYNPKGAPKGATKNPYDFCFNYKLEEFNFDDLIWGDIKASKVSYNDSNPDLGTPEKIIQFILQGHFYLLFVFLEYDTTEDNTVLFKPFPDGKYVRCQFLKDIHHSVRINPKPQFQVNIHEPEEYRTRVEFIDLFYKKYAESIDRIIEKQTKKKNALEKRFKEIKKMVMKYPT